MCLFLRRSLQNCEERTREGVVQHVKTLSNLVTPEIEKLPVQSKSSCAKKSTVTLLPLADDGGRSGAAFLPPSAATTGTDGRRDAVRISNDDATTTAVSATLTACVQSTLGG